MAGDVSSKRRRERRFGSATAPLRGTPRCETPAGFDDGLRARGPGVRYATPGWVVELLRSWRDGGFDFTLPMDQTLVARKNGQLFSPTTDTHIIEGPSRCRLE